MSTRKATATAFGDRNGPLLVDFLPRGDTINAAAYCQALKNYIEQLKTNARNADTRSPPAAR
jgi:hypothetical protein